MKGMVYKDLLLSRKNILVYMVIGLLFAATLGESAILGMMGAYIMAIPISIFSIDKAAHWDSYAVSMPGGRRGMVRARYVSVILTDLLGALYVAILCVVFSFEFVESMVSMMFLLLMLCILLPLIYQYGVNYAGIMLGISMAVVFFVIYLMSSSETVEFLMQNAPIVMAVLLPIAMYLSYRISCAIVQKKEY